MLTLLVEERAACILKSGTSGRLDAIGASSSEKIEEASLVIILEADVRRDTE